MSKAGRSTALLIIVLLNLILVPFSHASRPQVQTITKRFKQDAGQQKYRATAGPGEGYMIHDANGVATCGEATSHELQVLKHQDPNIELKQISHVGEQITAQQTGLHIVLRATPQLDTNPTAKAAFIAAAARWEALIQNPITIIIDVDFGTTFFGQTLGPSTLGGALGQLTGPAGNYSDVRSRLINGASSAAETTLYTSLNGNVPTDLGPTDTVITSSALFRALGSLPAVAAEGEAGLPFTLPRIGFNSNFAFDFDPTNGIDTDKTDFDGVAVHEIGHVLGFTSKVGSGDVTTVSILDIFRFRPGTTLVTFPTANRIVSTGGEQVFFNGGNELRLSTASSGRTGGDGEQASHWKDDAQSGTHIGVMDPTIARGVREAITSNDLIAFDAFGYRLSGSAPPPDGDAVALTTGVPVNGSIGPSPDPGMTGILDETQYSIVVPPGTTQLKLDLSGDQDVDLYARFGAKLVIEDGDLIADHISETVNPTESITINANSDPPLRVGTYFIGVANFGAAATYNVTATVTTTPGGGGGSAPTLSNVRARLAGDILTFNGTVADPDADIAQAQSTLLDGDGNLLASSPMFPVPFGGSMSVNFELEFEDLNEFPTAEKATLRFADGQGHTSSVVTVDFSEADAGGPTIKNVNISGSKLVIKGKDLAGQLIVEINGVDFATLNVSGNKKAKVPGGANVLRNGPNRIRVRHGTLQSNIFILED